MGLYGPQFKEELLAQMRERQKDHCGPELREADAQHAEGLVAQELRRLGWTEADFAQRRKGDLDKVRMARRLRQESTMTLNWIAQSGNLKPVVDFFTARAH